jgi:hypothetical protein
MSSSLETLRDNLLVLRARGINLVHESLTITVKEVCTGDVLLPEPYFWDEEAPFKPSRDLFQDIQPDVAPQIVLPKNIKLRRLKASSKPLSLLRLLDQLKKIFVHLLVIDPDQATKCAIYLHRAETRRQIEATEANKSRSMSLVYDEVFPVNLPPIEGAPNSPDGPWLIEMRMRKVFNFRGRNDLNNLRPT